MAEGAVVSGLSSTVNSLPLAASSRTASADGESGDFVTISVATLPAAARNRWRLGSAAPFARSVATARLTNRAVLGEREGAGTRRRPGIDQAHLNDIESAWCACKPAPRPAALELHPIQYRDRCIVRKVMLQDVDDDRI